MDLPLIWLWSLRTAGNLIRAIFVLHVMLRLHEDQRSFSELRHRMLEKGNICTMSKWFNCNALLESEPGFVAGDWWSIPPLVVFIQNLRIPTHNACHYAFTFWWTGGPFVNFHGFTMLYLFILFSDLIFPVTPCRFSMADSGRQVTRNWQMSSSGVSFHWMIAMIFMMKSHEILPWCFQDLTLGVPQHWTYSEGLCKISKAPASKAPATSLSKIKKQKHLESFRLFDPTLPKKIVSPDPKKRSFFHADRVSTVSPCRGPILRWPVWPWVMWCQGRWKVWCWSSARNFEPLNGWDKMWWFYKEKWGINKTTRWWMIHEWWWYLMIYHFTMVFFLPPTLFSL